MGKHRGPVPTRQIKQVVQILGALNLPEYREILERQLDGHLDCVQLKEVHIALSDQLGRQIVRDQSLRDAVSFQVIPVNAYKLGQNLYHEVKFYM